MFKPPRAVYFSLDRYCKNHWTLLIGIRRAEKSSCCFIGFYFIFLDSVVHIFIKCLFYGGTHRTYLQVLAITRTLTCWWFLILNVEILSFSQEIILLIHLGPCHWFHIFSILGLWPDPWRIGILDLQGWQLTLVIPLFLAIKCQDVICILSMGKAAL